MTHHPLLFTLAAIGINETVYLIRKRRAGERPVCVIGEDCHKVLESRYNNVLGVHNDVLGLIFYIVTSFITAFLVLEFQPQALFERIAKVLIFSGTIFSVFAIMLQWQVIKAWCFWCLLSAATVFIMMAVVLTSRLTL